MYGYGKNIDNFIIPMKIRLHRIFIICIKDKLKEIDRENIMSPVWMI